MFDSAQEVLEEEETRVVTCQDTDTEMNENNHMFRILEARAVVVIDLTKTVTAEALSEVGLEVPGITEQDACRWGHRIMDMTVQGVIGVCDQFSFQHCR